jgi:hypothetical protein
MPECDCDREDVRPLPRRHAIEMAHELGEEIVGEEFLDDQLHERARPREPRRARCELAHRTRTELVPPVFGVEVLFGSGGFFEIVVDVDYGTTDLAHGCSSTSDGVRQRWRADNAEGL